MRRRAETPLVRAVRMVSALPVASDEAWYEAIMFATDVLADLEQLPASRPPARD